MPPILADVCVSNEGLGVFGAVVAALWSALVLLHRSAIEAIRERVRDHSRQLVDARRRLDECEERHRASEGRD